MTTKGKPTESEGAEDLPRPAAAARAAKGAAPAAPGADAIVAPIAAAQAEAVKTLGEAVSIGKETIETVAKASADAAAKGYDQALDLGREQVAAAVKAHGAVFEGYEDAIAFQRDTFDALVKSGTILTQGLHDLSRAAIGLVQVSIEDNVAAAKAVLGARTVQDLIDAQADLTRGNLDRLLAEGSRLGDHTVRLIEDSVAPLTARVEAALERALHAA